ncbi:diamine acetyltransferase 2 [Plakobranchus ocellatus]|uniref:Diamine acetyltransferase 2 n=1 Tax=Plakobranchus ocellatus TaxID=259542 RepID=A0AAV3XVD2_9GAST|nr:diamine acetyltransferase 2 [Plakobranchus ocellatus]
MDGESAVVNVPDGASTVVGVPDGESAVVTLNLGSVRTKGRPKGQDRISRFAKKRKLATNTVVGESVENSRRALHQQHLQRMFVEFKNPCHRVMHAALLAIMRKVNISANLVRVIDHRYDKATTAILSNRTVEGKGDIWHKNRMEMRRSLYILSRNFKIDIPRQQSRSQKSLGNAD